jgi:hypothetical protein
MEMSFDHYFGMSEISLFAWRVLHCHQVQEGIDSFGTAVIVAILPCSIGELLEVCFLERLTYGHLERENHIKSNDAHILCKYLR